MNTYSKLQVFATDAGSFAGGGWLWFEGPLVLFHQ
jgi:hypothetical protein